MGPAEYSENSVLGVSSMITRVLGTLIVAGTFVIGNSCLADDIQPDGQIFLKDFPNPDGTPLPETPDTVGEYGEARFFITSNQASGGTKTKDVDQRTLLTWKDPLTLPHSRASCVKWASGNWPWPAKGGWKTCIGWKTQFQWMFAEADLKISASTAAADLTIDWVKNTSNTCLSTGAVAGAVAAIYSGGQAAANAFAATTQVCMEAAIIQFAGGKVSVSVPFGSHWGGWE